VSLSYGIDADSFLDLFPCLCQCIADFPPSSSTTEVVAKASGNVVGLQLLQMRAVYNVFEALMHSSMAAEREADAEQHGKSVIGQTSGVDTSKATKSSPSLPLPSSVVVQSVHWSHVVNTVEHALRSLETILFPSSIKSSPSIDPLLCVAVSGAMHFVATYHNYLPHRDEYDPLYVEPQVERHTTRIFSRWKQSPLLVAALTKGCLTIENNDTDATIVRGNVIPVISCLPSAPLRLPYEIACMTDIATSYVRWFHSVWKLELNRDSLGTVVMERKETLTTMVSSSSSTSLASTMSMADALYQQLHSISNGEVWKSIRRMVSMDTTARVSDRVTRETNNDEVEYELIADWPNDRHTAILAYHIITLLTLIHEDVSWSPSDNITSSLYASSLQLLPSLHHSGNQLLSLTLARSLTFDGEQFRNAIQHHSQDIKMDTRRIDAALHDVWSIFGHYLADNTNSASSVMPITAATTKSMVEGITREMMAGMGLPFSITTATLAIQPPPPDYVLPFDAIPSPYTKRGVKSEQSTSSSSEGAVTHNTTWLLLPLKRSRFLVDVALPTPPPSLLPGSAADNKNNSDTSGNDDSANLVLSVELKQRVVQSYLTYLVTLQSLGLFNGNHTVLSRALMEVFTLGGDIYHDASISSLLSLLFRQIFTLPSSDTTTVRASIIAHCVDNDTTTSPFEAVPRLLATTIPTSTGSDLTASNNFDFDAPHMRIWGRSVFPFLKGGSFVSSPFDDYRSVICHCIV
jgi:hypothetical protein